MTGRGTPGRMASLEYGGYTAHHIYNKLNFLIVIQQYILINDLKEKGFFNVWISHRNHLGH
jgi:hypothetical protein